MPGDELCLKAPDDGFQLHVGPANYDDPAELEKWTLPAGGFPGQGPDVNWCFYMKTPNDVDTYTGGYYSHMRPGSHHFIMFGLAAGTDVPDSEVPNDCGDRNGQVFGGANFLAGATREVQNATMFGDAPEDQGLGSPIPAHQQLNMNLHFVNITDHPILEELWVNMINKPSDEVTNIVKAIEWLGGVGMSIKPQEHTVLDSSKNSECNAPLGDTRLLGVTAHMHANTVRVSMYHESPDVEKELIFDDFNWSEPTVWLFNSKYTNKAPGADRSLAKSGSAKNGVFMAGTQDKFSWECEVNNTTNETLKFSDKAYSGEMCNVFGMYSSPVAQAPWMCFFL